MRPHGMPQVRIVNENIELLKDVVAKDSPHREVG